MTTGETRVSDDVKADALIWSRHSVGWRWLACSHFYQPAGQACHTLTASAPALYSLRC